MWRSRETHSRKIAESEYAQQTGLAASSVTDDDQFPSWSHVSRVRRYNGAVSGSRPTARMWLEVVPLDETGGLRMGLDQRTDANTGVDKKKWTWGASRAIFRPGCRRSGTPMQARADQLRIEVYCCKSPLGIRADGRRRERGRIGEAVMKKRRCEG
jgi:hypothetical protein